MVSAKFHFVEINWVIYFPDTGNEGRDYPRYGVAYRDRRRGESQPGVRINLGEVLNLPDIRDNYPHTVGYFLHATGRGKNYVPRYLQTRLVVNQEDFFNFLDDQDI